MRYWAYDLLIQKLQNDTKIFGAQRIGDNIIRVDFDKSGSYAFDLSSGSVFHPTHESFAKRYSAPFDTVLFKNFAKSKIISINLSKNDKIISIKAKTEQGYKSEDFELLLEMTPKSKNAIILDDGEIIIQALRYESLDSGRQVRVGSKLDSLPKAPFEFGERPLEIEDIDSYLENLVEKEQNKALESLKLQKTLSIRKKISNMAKELNSLPRQEGLQESAQVLVAAANFALMNIDSLDIYAKKLDFVMDEQAVSVEMPNVKKMTEIPDALFAKSKKLKKRALGVAKERENLEGKVAFFEKLIAIVQNAKSGSEIDFYLPKQLKNNKQQSDGDMHELLVDGHKVIIGKNAKGNEKLLKNARANDYWFHLKDISSSHVILGCTKNEPSRALLEKTAKICAEFSLSQQGAFEVDFAKRRNVSPRGGGRAEYVNYKTIRVLLD